MTEIDWSRQSYRSWSDLSEVRALLAAGADPNTLTRGRGRPLHHAAEYGSAEVVTELARRVDDVDAVDDGRTALWQAVHAGRPANARALVAAGADPDRPMMSGWSPARLSLAGPTPGLFATDATLTEAEATAAARAHTLVGALADLDSDGISVCCVGGVDATEAIRRLGATVITEDLDIDGMWDAPEEEAILILGVTDVPGGCIVGQPWSYGASMPLLAVLLSAGTTAYGLYVNPSSGNQGMSVHNGVVTGGDLDPGSGWSPPDAPAPEILHNFLYRNRAVAYSCAYAGVHPTDTRPFTEPDHWIRLPAR